MFICNFSYGATMQDGGKRERSNATQLHKWLIKLVYTKYFGQELKSSLERVCFLVEVLEIVGIHA